MGELSQWASAWAHREMCAFIALVPCTFQLVAVTMELNVFYRLVSGSLGLRDRCTIGTGGAWLRVCLRTCPPAPHTKQNDKKRNCVKGAKEHSRERQKYM